MATWTQEEFERAVAESTSVAQVLKRLGLKAAGGNYATVNKFIKEFNIDSSHFVGQSWSKGTNIGPRKPLDYYLVNGRRTGSHNLKLRLLREGVFDHKCYSCELVEWMEKPIPLELEHINGKHDDNRINNLTLLCPNCHAQTETYRGKNIRPRSPIGRDTKLKISQV